MEPQFCAPLLNRTDKPLAVLYLDSGNVCLAPLLTVFSVTVCCANIDINGLVTIHIFLCLANEEFQTLSVHSVGAWVLMCWKSYSSRSDLTVFEPHCFRLLHDFAQMVFLRQFSMPIPDLTEPPLPSHASHPRIITRFVSVALACGIVLAAHWLRITCCV
jgi:hypothetical protein